MIALPDPVTPAAEPKRLSVFIYGSCVSRDTFEYLAPERYQLVRYVARQSLVSAFSHPCPPPFDLRRLTSDFQRRMLLSDAQSSLPRAIEEHAEQVDLLFWDIFDERLGFFEAEGGVLTNTVELITAQREGHADRLNNLISFGTERHLQRFRESLAAWKALLVEQDLLDKAILIAPPWATLSSTGERVPASFGLSSEEARPIVAIYVEEIQVALGIPIITLPHHKTIADASHRWGPAPFHYTDETYEQIARRIDGFTRRENAQEATSNTEDSGRDTNTS